MSKLLEQINIESKIGSIKDLVFPVSNTYDFSNKDKVVFVNTGDVHEGKFLHQNYSNTKKLPGQAKKIIEFGDIVFSEIRPKNRHFALVDFDSKDYVVSTKLIVLKVKENIDPRFAYIVLTADQNLREFQNIAESRSGTFPQITFEAIADYEVNIPNLPIQKKIAGILSAYDAKIENNNKIIKNLEATAQTIFNEWFVEFEFPSTGGVPVGWGGSSAWQSGSIQETTSASSHSSTGGEKRNTQNYLSLPYNPKLRDRAKELRKAGNLAEVLLWLQLKNKQFLEFDFDRQKIIGNYIVDFYCANIGLVVEIDGSSHDEKYEYDKERDNYLESLGLSVLHFADADVRGNTEAVLKEITGVLEKPPRPTGTPPTEGKVPPRLSATPPQEGNKYKSSGGKMVESEMGEIPEGWEAFKFRDLFIFIKGKKPAEVSGDQKEGFLQQILIDSFENGKKLYADKQGMVIASDEDLLMVMDGASSGRIEFGITGIVGSTMSKLQLNKSIRSILYFYLKSKEKDIKDNTSGSAIPHTDKEKVYGYEIALPKDTEYFEKTLLSFIKGVEKLNNENISLKESRDQLLAKLI